MIENKKKRTLKFIIFLSFLGLLVSGYLVNLQYTGNMAPCDINDTFTCSLVNASKYAEVFGIPMSVIGFVGYSLLGLIGFCLYRREKWNERSLFKKLANSKLLVGLSVIAVLISSWLTYAEFFLIKALCIFCLISQVIILGILLFSYNYYRLRKKQKQLLEVIE